MKDKKKFIGMNKSSVVSQLKSLWDSIIQKKPEYDMSGLVEENKLTWVFRNIANLGNSHYAYQQYPKPELNNGIFNIQNASTELTTVALLSDWATNTEESHLIARQASNNDYSIHLGDTYYVGNKKEIADNFNTYYDGTWPYGKLGSFALLGNHEMYSSGRSYFLQLLPNMGNFVKGRDQPQQASFFCLENDYWRIIGLDTGYYSLKGFLGLKPNENLDLHDQQKEWLEKTVRLNDDKRGIIILSHHQCFSAFEKEEFAIPGQYISSLMNPGRDILWLWGHEHWFSVYGANKLENGSNVFARCVGNSGMPVEINKGKEAKVTKNPDALNPANRNLTLYDNRKRETVDGIDLGYNGFVTMNLEGSNLTMNYFDDNDKQKQPRKILQEHWTIDPATGKLTGTDIVDLTANQTQKLKIFSGDIKNAIRD